MEPQRQTGQPLFPKILWNRPLNRAGAGRLLLVGGHGGAFSTLQAVYQLALAAGAGECLVAVPDSLRSTLADFPDARFLPANPSGSLGKAALGEILHLAEESDGIILGADLSASSETSVLVESIINETDKPIVVFGDIFASLKHDLSQVMKRGRTLVVADPRQTMLLANALQRPVHISNDPDYQNKLELAGTVVKENPADLVMVSRELIVAARDQTSVTTSVSAMEFFLPAAVAVMATFWIQNQSRPFEGLTAGAYALREARDQLSKSEHDVLTVTELSKSLEKTLRQAEF